MLSSPSLLFTRLVVVVVVVVVVDGDFFFLRFFFFFLFDMFEFKEQIPRKYTNISLSTRSLYPLCGRFTLRARSRNARKSECVSVEEDAKGKQWCVRMGSFLSRFSQTSRKGLKSRDFEKHATDDDVNEQEEEEEKKREECARKRRTALLRWLSKPSSDARVNEPPPFRRRREEKVTTKTCLKTNF